MGSRMTAEMETNNSLPTSAIKPYTLFDEQNIENGHFDVIFQFTIEDGKKLHAHSFVLWSVSDVFEAMLFGPWAKKDPIPITGHSYDDFKEFIKFLYLGYCNIIPANEMKMLDLAESYNVEFVRNACDTFFAEVLRSNKKMLIQKPKAYLRAFDRIKLYSLPKTEQEIAEAYFIRDLIREPRFLEFKKEMIITVLKKDHAPIKEKRVLKMVYKWAKTRCPQSIEDKTEFIRSEIDEFLPLIKFEYMDIVFLQQYLVLRLFLLPSPDDIFDLVRGASETYGNLLHKELKEKAYMALQRRKIYFIDGNNNIASAWIKEKQIPQTIKNLLLQKRCQSKSHLLSKNECIWTIEIPAPKLKFDFYHTEVSIYYLIRNSSSGKLGLKNLLSSGDFDEIAENGETKDYEIIAHLQLEDGYKTFDISDGKCKLKVIDYSELAKYF